MTIMVEYEPQPSRRPRGLSALVDHATESHLRAVAVLLLVSFLSFLPGFFQIPPVDRDEARFAQATKQMIETGDYVDIRFQDETRYKKPVGIYWLQAAVVKTAEAVGYRDARTTIWLYRLPSLLGGVGAVLLSYWTALAFVSRRAAVLAGLLLAGTILLGVETRLAKTDAMLLATVVAAMGALGRAYLGEHAAYGGTFHGWRLAAIFWTALASGILLKGPLILMFVGLTLGTLAIFDRSLGWLKELKPAVGIIWMLVLVLPWFLAMISRTGMSFFVESVGEDLFAKIASGQESHGAPPGLYVLLFWVTFWPGAPLALLAAPAVWSAWREPGARFLLAWIVPSWIVFEIVITKLPHYVLPLYPPIAILVAGVVNHHALSQARWLVRGTVGWFAVAAVASLAMIVGTIVIGRELGLLAWPFAAAATIFGLLAWLLFDADGPERALLRAITASILVAFTAYGVTFPSLTTLFPSAAIAEYLQKPGCDQPLVAAAGYHEPSLVFLLGTRTALVEGTGAADFLRAGGCRFAVIESHHERAFARRADALGLRYAPITRIEGINISGGRLISLAIYQAEGQP
jgi:4-amino-4-deoxy-L-arabinose transferase-like glycosyltransferase